ncbi:MAG: SPFH domain-containing protein [Phycisphaerae bacterium]|nr:SPFH domain-containing protein [Phycisphaerae bacterium]
MAVYETRTLNLNIKIFVPIIIFLIFIVAVATSIINVGPDEVGIVSKKFGGRKLPDGRIIAVEGENGFQAGVLMPGWHLWYWKWQYDIIKVKDTELNPGTVGIVVAKDGISLPEGEIYAPQWEEPDKMINDAVYFLTKGKGFKGPQLTVLQPGKYKINSKLFEVKQVPVTNVRVGTVAVIKSNVGQRVASDDGLVEKDQRGIWRTPLLPQEYYLNTNAYEVTIIDTRQQKVSYTAESERGEAKVQPLQPITVRSADGFTFPVDVRVTYKIDKENASKVVATVGDDQLVLDKLITPSVRASFRNNAEKVKALDYVQNRSKQEEQCTNELQRELAQYGITILAVRIGDVGDEKSLGQLLKTQTDKEIARQEQQTFIEQQKAAEQEKALTKTTQEAEEEKRLATASYNVKVAEQEKQQRIINAEAEAEMVKTVATAQAEAYKKISEVIGSDNAALIEILKLIAAENIDITPDVMVSGAGSGIPDALMGTILKDMVKEKKAP